MPFRPISRMLRSSDGTHIYAEAAGDPQKPYVVFVHGLHLSCLVFDGLFTNPDLLSEYFLVRYDIRAHGRSGMPEDAAAYSSSLFADDYATVARAFEIRRPILVGWSYGASVICDIYARQEPSEDALAGVVYIAGLPWTGAMLGRIITPLTGELILGHMDAGDAAHFRATICGFVDALFRDAGTVDVRERMACLGHALLQTPHVTEHLLMRAQDPARLIEAGRAGLPLLVLYGEEDKLVRGNVVAQEMEPYFKDLEVHRVEGGGHHPVYEKPEETARVLLRFFQRVTVRSGKTMPP